MAMSDSDASRGTSLKALAAAGRHPSLPVRLAVPFGELVLESPLRLLPGRRLTAHARLNGVPVIAKLFFNHRKSLRDAEREAQRLARLRALRVPAPAVLGDSGADDQGRVLVLEKLPGESALNVYQNRYRDGEGVATATALVAFLATLHEHGCRQEDVHLGNFLIDRQRLYLVDAGSVVLDETPSAAARCANLAALLAQFHPLDTLDLDVFRAAYGAAAPPEKALAKALHQARRRRYRHALGKLRRDCTDYAVVHGGGLRGMARRPLAPDLQALLEADIDRIMAAGEMLKPGNSSTVCRVQWRGRDWVIKRYNTKSLGHRIRKQFKPSRAFRSWRNACWLELIGLDTPPAVGYVERRPLGVLDTAYFICHYVAGPALAELHEPAALASATEQMERLFNLMAALRFNHGDLKATNFLWVDGRLCILDLDAMELDLPVREVAARVARDRQRWRRNFMPGD